MNTEKGMAADGFYGVGNVRIAFHRNCVVTQELRDFRRDVPARSCFQVLVLMPGN